LAKQWATDVRKTINDGVATRIDKGRRRARHVTPSASLPPPRRRHHCRCRHRRCDHQMRQL